MQLVLAHDAVIISRRYYANSIGYPSESASSSKWHAYCLVRQSLSGQAPVYLADDCRLVSDSSLLGALCGQLTFRLAWCREHSAAMATELLQPRDLACGNPFQSSCVMLTSPTDCSDDSWRDTFFGKHKHGGLRLLICGAVEKNTYLPWYLACTFSEKLFPVFCVPKTLKPSH